MSYTIGQLARLSGVPVKTIRFYSDTGVLPERERTSGGYRLYEDDDRVRLELVRALREMDVDLATIKSLGERDLRQTLLLHLRTVEARIKSLQRTRAVLRATLERGDPTDDDLRRLNALGRLGTAELTALVNDFVDDVSDGNPALEEWIGNLRVAMVPDLPDEPSIEQLDAWLELTELLADAGFRASLRDMNSDFWENADEIDVAAWQAANNLIMDEALAAARKGVAPESEAAAPIVSRIVTIMAESQSRPRESIVRDYAEYDPRASHYWKLLAVINGTPWPSEIMIAYDWISAAIACHFR
ncbi:MerR family transcriptional regulator [Streptosporangium sp. NPDC000396]|uniref:MerR family transcriptional regulator n=1 Tax=Streptosporangium sp. NPDC000396 TaxID=3366185 RepID=UPI003698B136